MRALDVLYFSIRLLGGRLFGAVGSGRLSIIFLWAVGSGFQCRRAIGFSEELVGSERIFGLTA